MTCEAIHVRRGPTGYALETIRCLSHDGRFHVGVATFGRYTWRPEDDPAERARRHLAASPFFPGVNDSNAADLLEQNTGELRPPPIPRQQCEACGVDFKPKKREGARYCSVACRFGWAA